MGWLELVSLLRKLLPLLSRAVPMLETTMAARSATRAEAAVALGTASEAVRTDVQQLATSSAAGQRTLQHTLESMHAEHTASLLSLSGNLQHFQGITEENTRRLDARLDAIEAQLASFLTWLKAAALLSGVVLLIILVLIVVAVYTGRHTA